MKFDKIVAFGDSFVWGDELLDPALIDHEYAHPIMIENKVYRESHAFAGLIGHHYGVPVDNHAWPGASLESTIWTYLWWIEQETLPLERCLVVVGLTGGSRFSFYNPRHVSQANDPAWNRFIHSSWVLSDGGKIGQDWIDLTRRYVALTDCDAVVRLRWRQALLFFHGQRLQHAGLMQFKTLQSTLSSTVSTLVWPNLSLQCFFDHLSNREDYVGVRGHPTERGHRDIADRLITEIDHVILSE